MDRAADATTARMEVRTFREGALARAGHDLALDVTRFEVRLVGAELTARVDAGSLRVRCALRDGRDDPTALSARDRAQIDEAARDEVLGARAHPWITLRATVPEGFARGALRGALTLRGVTRPVALEVSPDGAGLLARAELRQGDFGMRPYRALMGALRVRDLVEVRAALPWG